MKRRVLLAGILAFIGAGCSHLEKAPEPFGQEIAGRFSIIVTGQGNRQTHAGNFSLVFSEKSMRLDLGHPLAGVQARLLSEPGVTRLETADGMIRVGNSSEQLMQQELGFFLPIEPFAKWVTQKIVTTEPQTDNGWSVRCLEQDPNGLPALVRLTRDETAFTPGIRLTVVIDTRRAHDAR